MIIDRFHGETRGQSSQSFTELRHAVYECIASGGGGKMRRVEDSNATSEHFGAISVFREAS